MDNEYQERLRADADSGNRIAERLLLNAWLVEENNGEIRALLDRYATRNDDAGKWFLEAELQCFHSWPGAQSWQGLLQASCDAGHAEALFVSSVYHEWARFSGILPSSGPEVEVLWQDGWQEWTVPEWTPMIEDKGVKIERSRPFAPRAIIGYLRALLGPQLRPSEVIDPQTGNSIAHPVRINQSAQWLPEHLGWAGKLLECRLAETCGYIVSCGEVLNLLHYKPGQRYKTHVDCISTEQARSPDGQLQGGQRTMTVLLAMGNDDYTGGDTYFPRLEEGFKSAIGELIRFNNADASGQPLPASLHEGRPVESGEKWLLSKWVRQLPTPYGTEVSLARPRAD